MFTLISYDDYIELLKKSMNSMTNEEFHKMLMTSQDYELLEYQDMNKLKKIYDIVKDEEYLSEKEIIVLKEMGRTHEHTKEK